MDTTKEMLVPLRQTTHLLKKHGVTLDGLKVGQKEFEKVTVKKP